MKKLILLVFTMVSSSFVLPPVSSEAATHCRAVEWKAPRNLPLKDIKSKLDTIPREDIVQMAWVGNLESDATDDGGSTASLSRGNRFELTTSRLLQGDVLDDHGGRVDSECGDRDLAEAARRTQVDLYAFAALHTSQKIR